MLFPWAFFVSFPSWFCIDSGCLDEYNDSVAKLIIQAKIAEVIYRDVKDDYEGIKLLQKANIKTIHLQVQWQLYHLRPLLRDVVEEELRRKLIIAKKSETDS